MELKRIHWNLIDCNPMRSNESNGVNSTSESKLIWQISRLLTNYSTLCIVKHIFVKNFCVPRYICQNADAQKTQNLAQAHMIICGPKIAQK